MNDECMMNGWMDARSEDAEIGGPDSPSVPPPRTLCPPSSLPHSNPIIPTTVQFPNTMHTNHHRECETIGAEASSLSLFRNPVGTQYLAKVDGFLKLRQTPEFQKEPGKL